MFRPSAMKLWALCGLLASLVVPADAQGTAQPTSVGPEPDADRRQIVPFLDGTEVFLNVPRDGSIFEAQIAPNLVITQNFADLIDVSTLATQKRHWAYSVSINPLVRLRMLQAYSAPVRTPSYMPKVTLQVFSFVGAPAAQVGMWAAQVTVGHHSNGQDGCLFLDQQLVNGTCTPKPLDRDPRTAPVNKRDGNFSTNYLTLGVRYRRTRLDTDNRGKSLF